MKNFNKSESEETLKKEMNKLQELKDKISPYRIGDEVVCYWGSSDYDQEGIVVDNLVLYNQYYNYSAFSPEKCEQGCIVRLKNKKLPTGFEVGNNEVIPFRQIKKISKGEV